MGLQILGTSSLCKWAHGRMLNTQMQVFAAGLCRLKEQLNLRTLDWHQRAYHWPRVSGCANRAQDSRMDTNWRVVITVAKVSAPKALMVWMMKSCPAPHAPGLSLVPAHFC